MKLIRSEYHIQSDGEVYESRHEFINVYRISSFKVIKGKYGDKVVYCIVGVIPWDFTYCFAMYEDKVSANGALDLFVENLSQ